MVRIPAASLAALTLAALLAAGPRTRAQVKPAADPPDEAAKSKQEGGDGARARGFFDNPGKSLKKLGGDVSNAGHQAGGDLSNAAKKAGGDVSNAAKKAGGKVAKTTHKAGKELADFSHKAGGQAGANYHRLSAAAVKAVKGSSLYRKFQERALSLFMESPHITRINPHYPGSPVYYINGMLTGSTQAVNEAEALSDHLRRPVFLIRNPTVLEGSTGTPHCADDISEAIYDKTWPERLIGVDLSVLLPSLSAPSPPIAELNPTTRQITHVLYHARGPISIVSHSQGCLIVRNALLAAALLDRERTVEHEVAWVATGTPVNDREVWPRPAKYHYLINATDPVAALIGTRGGPGARNSLGHAARDHEPIRNYFPRVTPAMLFP